MDIQGLICRQAQNFHDKPAVIFKETEISYSQLKEQVLKTAQALRVQGITAGDKVAIYLPNSPEYIFSYLALFSLRCTVVPLDFMLTQEEIVNFLRHSDSKALIASGKKGVDFNAVRSQCAVLENIFSYPAPGGSEGAGALVDLSALTSAADPQPVEVDSNDNDLAAIFYTSGSTGHPKGVMLTYGHLDNPVNCIRSFLTVDDNDSYLCAGVPFSHVAGLDYMLFMLFFGSTLVLMDRFQPFEALKCISQSKPTILCIVPAMFVAILSLKDYSAFDLSSLRYAVVFGAPSSPALLKRFQSLCPDAQLRNGWGMTETAAPNTLSPADIAKLDSIGPFGAGMEAKIVDEKGQPVADNERGELLVKGQAVMAGYYKEEELTAEVLTEDGWLKTGDIAVRDEDGLYYLVGRIKEMIKVAGEIVFSPEVEGVLYRHPKIEAAAVIGVPDELRGEVPKAFIVIKDGETLGVDELRQFCREKMAHFKIPQSFEWKDTLPINRVGKVDKEALRQQLIADGAK